MGRFFKLQGPQRDTQKQGQQRQESQPFSNLAQTSSQLPSLKNNDELPCASAKVCKQVSKLSWLVVLTILKNTGQWEGLSHILWKINNVWNHQPVMKAISCDGMWYGFSPFPKYVRPASEFSTGFRLSEQNLAYKIAHWPSVSTLLQAQRTSFQTKWIDL